MIKKMAVASVAASILGLGFFASYSAEARGHGGWGHHSSYSSPSSHSTYHAPPPHATAPMAPPPAPAKPSVMGNIATTAAGTAGGMVVGNAISHAIEGDHSSEKVSDSKSADKNAVPHDVNSESVPVVADSGVSAAAKGLPQATDPCTPENEAKNPRIEELCGQLHQELRKVNGTTVQQGVAQK